MVTFFFFSCKQAAVFSNLSSFDFFLNSALFKLKGRTLFRKLQN